MKKALPILAGMLIAIGAGVIIAHAASTDYNALAPLPIGESGATLDTYTLSTYLSGIIKLLIAIGAMMSIFVTILGGVQYVASGITPSAKQDAKNRITNALIGLTLILTSYLILNSINPELVNISFTLPAIELQVATTTVATTAGAAWEDDSAVRAAFHPFITVYNSNCAKVGDSGCTSVAGLGSAVINGLEELRIACNCPIKITGGTEYWLHGNKNTELSLNTTTDHKPGGSVVDLSKNTTVTAYIENNGGTPTYESGCANGKHYKIGSAIYVDETSSAASTGVHWHVCY